MIIAYSINKFHTHFTLTFSVLDVEFLSEMPLGWNGKLPDVTIFWGLYARIKPPVVILHLQSIYKNFKNEIITADFSSKEI